MTVTDYFVEQTRPYDAGELDNQSYWIKRNKTEKKIVDRTANKTINKIKQEYIQTYNRTINEYKNLYLELEGKLQADGTISRSDLYKIDRYYQLQKELEDECYKLGMKENKILTQELTAMYTNSYMQVINDIIRIAGRTVVIDTKPSKLLVEAIVKTPWTSDGKMFSARIWQHQSQLVNGLQTTFTEMVLQGKRWTDISRALQTQFGVAKYQADRLVRTETAHAYITAEHDAYKKAGVDKVKVISYDCCDACEEYNGNIYYMDEIELPFHPNCRCDTIPIFDDDGE